MKQGWTEVRLVEVITSAQAGFASGEHDPAGTFQIRMNNVTTAGALDYSKQRRVPLDPKKVERFSLASGDVLFNTTNSPEMVGKSAYFPGHDERTVFSNHFLRLRTDVARLNPQYLARWLNLLFHRRTFEERCRKWVNQAAFDKSALLSLNIELPPIEEQRRIAAVLDQADRVRAKRRAALTLADDLNESIFLDMFGDPVTNPLGWPVTRIGPLLESATYGTSRKAGSAGALPVLRMGNLTSRGQLDLTNLKYMDLPPAEMTKHTVLQGDVLFNRTNSAELVGKSAVYRLTDPMAYAGYLVRLRCDGRVADPEYLGAFLNLASTKTVLRSMCKSIVGMANINAREVQAMRIPLPPTQLQADFATRVSAVDRAAAGYRTHADRLDDLFASLQDRAFRGEL